MSDSIPKPIAKFLQFLSRKSEPIAFREIPAELQKDNILLYVQRHRLATGLVRRKDYPDRKTDSFRIEGSPLLWYSNWGSPFTQTYWMLTGKGRIWIEEDELNQAGNDELGNELDCLVTMEQAAAYVQQSKRTLERWELPEPDFRGGGGKPHRWYWHKLRPALEKKTGRQLPERFPTSRIV